MESHNGSLIDAEAKSDEINQPPLLDITSDATDQQISQQRKKKVSFKEPLAVKINTQQSNEKKEDVIDEVIGTKEGNGVTYTNHVKAAHEGIKIPEISDLWWGGIDDGTTGEPQTNLK